MYPLSSFHVRLGDLFLAGICLSLLGCGAGISSDGSMAGGQLRGRVHGGQQPVSGANIQLYAAGTTGYGSSASPLLTSAVTTDATGSFTITGDYTCPSSTSELYIVATGGNPGLAAGTNNAAATLMAALGPCSLHGGQLTLDPNSFILINEVTTVASVYALAPFMGGDATHVGTSSTNAAGLANSFALVNNLVNTSTGTALTTTPSGYGTVPQAAIDTLANIFAACVNSTGVGSPCSALFGTATPVGGSTPTDTVQAIYDIARNPANNVSALYALGTATPPFQPTLSSAPNDWTLALTYTGIGLSGPQRMAIDGSGNVWIANNGVGSNSSFVTELSNNGMLLSGSAGYAVPNQFSSFGIAIDPTENVWVIGNETVNVAKLSSNGTVLSGTNGYTGGGLQHPRGIAIDGAGNAWVTDADSQSVIELSNNGTILSGSGGFKAGGLTNPDTIAIDTTGNVWVADLVDSTVAKFSNSGSVLSVASVGSQVNPISIAVDASGDPWFINAHPDSGAAVFKLSSSGSLLSPTAGFPSCVPPTPPTLPGRACGTNLGLPLALDGAGNAWSGTANNYLNMQGAIISSNYGLAELNSGGTLVSGSSGYVLGGVASIATNVVIDNSGNVWGDRAVNDNGTDVYSVTELVGAATPVVTPLSVGVQNGTLGQRP